MVVDLKVGIIDGYCVSEFWNLWVFMEGVGFSIVIDLEIW